MRNRVFTILCFGFLLFSLLPTIYEWYHRDRLPEIRAFELVHNYYTDYNFYISRIREGIEGHLTVLEKYTSEPHQGSFIHIMYLAMGWVARWVRVPWERGGDAYHMARIALGMTLLLLFAEYAKRAFYIEKKAAEVANENFGASPVSLAKKALFRIRGRARSQSGAAQNFIGSPQLSLFWWSLLAFLLAVTASSWPKLELVDGAYRFGGYMPWWSVMDSLQRITFIPHLLAGQALIVFLMMAASDDAVLARPGNWIFLGLLTLLMGFVFPPGIVFVYTALAVFVAYEILFDMRRTPKSERKGFVVSRIVSRGIIVLLSIPSFLYLNLMLSFYPWKRLAEFDIVHPLPFTYVEYIKALGPMLPLGLIGLVLALKTKEQTMRTSVVWVMTWIFLLVVFHFIPQQSPLRFSEMLPHLPLGILTAYLFYSITKRAEVGMPLSASPPSLFPSRQLYESAKGVAVLEKARLPARFKGKISSLTASRVSFPTRLSHVSWLLSLAIPIVLVILGLFHMYSSYLWQKDFVDHKMRAAWPFVPYGTYVMYPLKDFLTAMRFIQDSTSRDTVVLSEVTAGNYIPVYSGNTVYIGHDNAVNHEAKKEQVAAFFRGSMTSDDARSWMDSERLAVVFFGPQEQEEAGIADLVTRYPFLTEVYRNNFVIVYRVGT